MPYFKWTGTTLVGEIKKGKMAAFSATELADRLLQQGVGLMCCRVLYRPILLVSRISPLEKGQVAQRIATLLSAGITLPDAIGFSAQHTSRPLLYDNLFSLASDIKGGIIFPIAIKKQSVLYDSIAQTMFVSGYESGNLVVAFESVARYYHMHHRLHKNVRSLMAMPIITLLFFIGISIFIFIFIMPRFEQMFATLNHQLPLCTRYMLAISWFMTSRYMIYMIVCAVAFIVVAKQYYGTVFMQHIPGISSLLMWHHIGQALYSLSLLITSGVTMPEALHIISTFTTDKQIKNIFLMLHDGLQHGRLLSDAMFDVSVFSPEVIALVRVGEESGNLGPALEHAAQLYSDDVVERVKRLIFWLQPIMIVVLGILIAALIFSVYLPIMELSHVL